LGSIWAGYQHGLYNWVRLVANPLKNSSAVDPSINWVASELNRKHSQCIFDLSNNGLVNAISNLPACTRFSYIIYADKKFEGEIIESLTAKLPPAIVYSSDYWSYSIDGKNMVTRFPNLDLFIKRNYPIESCNYGYCMRYKD
jgi:hypothetical protein